MISEIVTFSEWTDFVIHQFDPGKATSIPHRLDTSTAISAIGWWRLEHSLVEANGLLVTKALVNLYDEEEIEVMQFLSNGQVFWWTNQSVWTIWSNGLMEFMKQTPRNPPKPGVRQSPEDVIASSWTDFVYYPTKPDKPISVRDRLDTSKAISAFGWLQNAYAYFSGVLLTKDLGTRASDADVETMHFHSNGHVCWWTKRAAWTIFDAGQMEVITRLPRNPFVSVNDLFLQEEQEDRERTSPFEAVFNRNQNV